jgi:ribosomal protein S18 acetylase RimI-like enzyme
MLAPYRTVTTTTLTLRPLVPSDATLVRPLVRRILERTTYAEQPIATLEGALQGFSDECLGIVASDPDEIVGLVLFGLVAGSSGAGRVYLVAVAERARRQGVATRLVEAACADLSARGGRFVFAELPEDSDLTSSHELFRARGFQKEGQVPEFFRPGIGLVLLRRALTS